MFDVWHDAGFLDRAGVEIGTNLAYSKALGANILIQLKIHLNMQEIYSLVSNAREYPHFDVVAEWSALDKECVLASPTRPYQWASRMIYSQTFYFHWRVWSHDR